MVGARTEEWGAALNTPIPSPYYRRLQLCPALFQMPFFIRPVVVRGYGYGGAADSNRPIVLSKHGR
jgi:hypothetical protein